MNRTEIHALETDNGPDPAVVSVGSVRRTDRCQGHPRRRPRGTENMLSEWEIKSRAHRCARTGKPFEDGATIYTMLFRDRSEFRREDISEAAWLQRTDAVQPFSLWKSVYHAAPAPRAPEPMPRESVEELLRRLIQEDREEHMNARYVLAVMLERKKVLKQVDVRETAEEKVLIYEHARSGEVFIIADPRLRLAELDKVQEQVYALLAGISQKVQPEQ